MNRELVYNALIVVLILLLFITQCNKAGRVDQEYIRHVDTVFVYDSVVNTKTVIRPKPYTVYIPVHDTFFSDITIPAGQEVVTYKDSLVDSLCASYVTSDITGTLLRQSISHRVFMANRTITITDTVPVKVPHSFAIMTGVALDLKSGPGIGLGVQYKRQEIHANYYPITRSFQVQLSYRILTK